MKPGPNDVKLTILITGDELLESQRFTIDMAVALGLDRRIEASLASGPSDAIAGTSIACWRDRPRPEGSATAYPDKSSSAYAALKQLRDRLQDENRSVWD
jgi:hypothetical protein